MGIKQQFVEQDVDVRRYEYDDSVVLAADLGPVEGSSVEVLEDTIIVVADGEQFDVDVDVEGDVQAFMKNGVLTIEVSA
ncbi:MAG: hypothetical protein ACI8XM_000816 [Haloarculaceae archaeon]|jgi:hypothetical protein